MAEEQAVDLFPRQSDDGGGCEEIRMILSQLHCKLYSKLPRLHVEISLLGPH